MRTRTMIFGFVCCLLITAIPALAQIPRTMNYQGSLKTLGGAPVTGSVSMTFALHDALTDGTQLWTETQTVAVTDGIYSVILGSSAPLNLAFDKPYYLQVSITDNGVTTALQPRQPLTSVPYARNADAVQGLTITGGGWVGIGTTAPNGLLHIGDFSQGDTGVFRFKNNWFSLEGSNGTDRYPYISFADENGQQVMMLGYGSKLNKYLDFSLANNHRLQFRGNGDFLQISDFNVGASIGIGTTSSLPGILRMRPLWSTPGIALTSIENQVGLFVQASNGNVGVGTTGPTQKFEVSGNAAIRTDSSNFTFIGNNFSLTGGNTLNYPCLTIADATGQRAMSLGLGSKSGKTIDFNLENGHILYLLGTGADVLRMYTSGGRLAFGTSSILPNAVSLVPFAGDGVAILNNTRATVGLFVRASDANVGIRTTTPQYALDVNGTIRATNVPVSSDRRWKTDIAPLNHALERLMQVRGVSYRWSDPARGDGPQIGVIAQEVEPVFPEVVFTDTEGYKSIDYARLVAPLIEAIKELNARNDALAAEINTLKSQNAEFERRLQALEAVK